MFSTRVKMILRLAAAAVAVLSISASAEEPAKRLFMASYEGSFDGWKVTMDRTLIQHADNTFQLHSKASNFFASVTEDSRFERFENSIKPLSYTYERKVFGKRKTEELSYDWQNMRVTYTKSDRKGSEVQQALTKGILDPASYQLALRADLYNDEGTLSYDFAKRNKIKNYQFKETGTTEFRLGDNTYKAVIVVRENDTKTKRTTVWLLPELEYTLAQLTHVDDDDKYEIRLKSYQSEANAVTQFYQSLSHTADK